jgi:hypothetical protein
MLWLCKVIPCTQRQPMDPAAWEALLRHIPKPLHDQLMLVTNSGQEIAVQIILRMDREFMAFKGRLAATQDAGRLFFLPYAQIDYIGFQKMVKDSEYEEWFGNLVIPTTGRGALPTPAAPPPPARKEQAPAPTPVANTPAPSAENESSDGSRTVNPVIKSAVLERFRSRGKTGSGVQPRVTLPNETQGS